MVIRRPFGPAGSDGPMKTLGPTFGREAGPLPITWGETDDTITGRDDLTSEQETHLAAVIAAHDPTRKLAPASASKLGLKRALAELGEWEAIKTAIGSDATMQEDWDLAIEVRRTDPLTQAMIAARGYTAAQVDDLLIRAAALVA